MEQLTDPNAAVITPKIPSSITPFCASNDLLNLPTDLYREVLKYLFLEDVRILDLALVNHKLREAYYSALSGIEIPKSEDLKPEDIPWLAQRNIVARKFRMWHFFDSETRRYIIQSKHVLESLNFGCSLIKDSDLRAIGLCPQLKSALFYQSEKLTSGGMEAFLRMNSQLESLSISAHPQFSNDLLRVIFEACPRVTDLVISHCPWVTDASLDLIATSPLMLRSLDIRMSKASRERIRCFIETAPPSLRYLGIGRSDLETKVLVLCKLALPALDDPDLGTQLLGLQSFREIFESRGNGELIARVSSWPRLLGRFVDYLSPTYDVNPRFQELALIVLYQYSTAFKADGIITSGLFPAFLANLSRLKHLSAEALGLISTIVEDNDDASQQIISNCLTQLILSPDIICYEELVGMISKGPTSHLVITFTDIFHRNLNHRTQSNVLRMFRMMLRSKHEISINALQAISDSNLLKYTLHELLSAIERTHNNVDQYGAYASFEMICLDIISSYGILCHRITTDAMVLGSFIPCLKKQIPKWSLLLICLAQIIKTLTDLHLTVPSDLISALLSLDISEDLLSCIVEICDRTLALNDDLFLQHLVDNGLLTFLTSALGLKLKSKVAAVAILQRVMRSDEKYLEMVSCLSLPRSVSRIIMKGFL